jgi:hypothetical protein
MGCCVLAAFVLALCPGHPARGAATPAAIAGVATAGVAAGRLVEQFEAAADALAVRAGQQDDIVSARMGNELRLAATDLAIALGDRRDTVFELLSQPLQQGFLCLNAMIDVANAESGKAMPMLEFKTLDLLVFTDRLRLGADADFYVASVDGLVQADLGADYQLDIKGPGFGTGPDGKQYSVQVTVGDTILPAEQLQAVGAGETTITVPHEVLAPLFQDGRIALAKVRIDTTVVKKRRVLFFLQTQATATYSAEFSLVLLPRMPGMVTGKEALKSAVKNFAVYTTSVVHQTQGCSATPCEWSQEIDLGPDETAIDVRRDCSGQCDADHAKRTGGAGTDFDILDGGHKVVVYRRNDGQESTTVTHYVDYRKTGSKSTDSPIGPLPVAYDKPFFLDLKPQNSDCSFAVTATSVTRQSSYLDSGMAESADHLLVKQGVTQTGGHCRVALVLKQP